MQLNASRSSIISSRFRGDVEQVNEKYVKLRDRNNVLRSEADNVRTLLMNAKYQNEKMEADIERMKLELTRLQIENQKLHAQAGGQGRKRKHAVMAGEIGVSESSPAVVMARVIKPVQPWIYPVDPDSSVVPLSESRADNAR